MKVFELAKKLKKKSKEILDAAEYLNIQVKSHLSKLNDDEVKKIIKYSIELYNFSLFYIEILEK